GPTSSTAPCASSSATRTSGSAPARPWSSTPAPRTGSAPPPRGPSNTSASSAGRASAPTSAPPSPAEAGAAARGPIRLEAGPLGPERRTCSRRPRCRRRNAGRGEGVAPHMWNSAELDLDAYLDFLEYEGERTPTLETLRSLQRAHVLSVRWDTIDGFLHRRVRLDLPSLQDKLLRRGRGGYCFEHVALFAAVLERLGFDFTAISSRVQLGADSRRPRPATHAMLL